MIGPGVGKGGVQGETGDVDAEFFDGGHRVAEDVRRVAVETEDEAALDDDAAVVECGYHLVEMAGGIESLAHAVQGVGSDRFKADEEIAAAGFRHEVKQTGILRDLGGDESAPSLPERAESGEQLLRVFDIVGQVEVVEGEGFSAQ